MAEARAQGGRPTDLHARRWGDDDDEEEEEEDEGVEDKEEEAAVVEEDDVDEGEGSLGLEDPLNDPLICPLINPSSVGVRQCGANDPLARNGSTSIQPMVFIIVPFLVAPPKHTRCVPTVVIEVVIEVVMEVVMEVVTEVVTEVVIEVVMEVVG